MSKIRLLVLLGAVATGIALLGFLHSDNPDDGETPVGETVMSEATETAGSSQSNRQASTASDGLRKTGPQEAVVEESRPLQSSGIDQFPLAPDSIAGVPHDVITQEMTAAFQESLISQAAYIEKLDCAGQQCNMDLRFFDGRQAASTTSDFMSAINASFAGDDARSGLQMTLVSIVKSEAGDWKTSLRIQSFEAPSYETEVTESGAIIIRSIDGNQ